MKTKVALPIELYIFLHFTGIAYGFSYGPALVVLGRYFDKKRGIASSLGNMGVSVGSLVFPPVIRLLLDSYGLRGALAVIGGILLNLCVAGALMRPVTFYQDKTDKIDHGQKVWATNSDVYDSNKVKIPSNDEKENHIIKADPINYYNLSNVVKNSDIIQTSSTQKQKLQGLDKRIQTTKYLCKKVVHFKVLKNALFRMWIPVCFLGIIGCVQIVIFIPPHAKDLQISDSDITLLVIIVGASNFISKILLAYFIYINLMPKHILIALSLIITGISCMFISFYTNFVTMTILSVIFGVFGSVYFGLFPAVLVDFVGLEHLSGAMAINMLMQGLGLSISNPILGKNSLRFFKFNKYLKLILGPYSFFLHFRISERHDWIISCFILPNGDHFDYQWCYSFPGTTMQTDGNKTNCCSIFTNTN